MATRLTVRKSGGSVIVSLPKAVLETLHLHVGSILVLSLDDNRIILAPATDELTLDDVLAGSPKEKLKMTDEDCEWAHSKSKGKEI